MIRSRGSDSRVLFVQALQVCLSPARKYDNRVNSVRCGYVGNLFGWEYLVCARRYSLPFQNIWLRKNFQLAHTILIGYTSYFIVAELILE